MKILLGIIASLGVGAGLAYLFDPDQGRRRRAQIRDRAVSATQSANERLEAKTRHWSNLARGYVAEARSLFARGRRAAQKTSARVAKPA
jgi:hypothetical protein